MPLPWPRNYQRRAILSWSFVGLGVDTYTATPALNLAATKQVRSQPRDDPNATVIPARWKRGRQLRCKFT